MPSMTRRCTGWAARSSAVLALLLIAGAVHADPLDTLVSSYPEKIARRDGDALIFRDGAHMDAGTVDTHKAFDQLLRDASIRDQFRLAYPRGAEILPPQKDFDPGRFRNETLFNALYGDCRKTKPDLVAVTWVNGEKILFARTNGAAAHLEAVAAEIAKLPRNVRRAAAPTAGTYVCRPVKDTGRLSMHAYGAAIDLNLKFSNYWLWETKGGNIPYRNAMPRQIVDIFEHHGFIWGGRWYHCDTMHFEYRPELLAAFGASR